MALVERWVVLIWVACFASFFFSPAISSQSQSFSLLGTNTLLATGSPEGSGSACCREEETGPVWAPHALRAPSLFSDVAADMNEAQCSRL